MENELGIKLFSRTQKGVELTEEGRHLYSKFSAIIDAENDLLKAVDLMLEKEDFSLRIGTYSSIALHFLPGVLQSFKEVYPSVKTTILVDDYMQHWIEKDIADIILSDQLVGAHNWQPLMADEYVAVVPAEAFLGKREISTEELYKHPFIRPDEANLDNYLEYSKFLDVFLGS